MTSYLYDIQSAWWARPEPPEVIANKVLRTLEAFEQLDPSFRNWGTIDKNGPAGHGMSIDTVRRDIGALIEANVVNSEWGEPQPNSGYEFWTGSGYFPYAPPDPRSLDFHLLAGAKSRNWYRFEIGSNVAPPDLNFVNSKIYRGALLALVSIWPAPWANAQCAIWGERPPTLPGEPPFPYSGYQMPWLSYLCAERAARVDVPPEVMTERTPDGGLLMISAEERFDPTNRDHMRRARLMAQIMIEHGGDPDW